MRSFELCQSAATHISTLGAYHFCRFLAFPVDLAVATWFKESYSLSTSCAFAPSYLLTAGIVHVATLSLKPNSAEAKLGLQQIMVALEGVEVVWPSAFRNRQLLSGANVKFDKTILPVFQEVNGNSKRRYLDAFGPEDDSQNGSSVGKKRGGGEDSAAGAGQSDGTHWMAFMLGLDISGVATPVVNVVPQTGPNTFNPAATGVFPRRSSLPEEFDRVPQPEDDDAAVTVGSDQPAFGGVDPYRQDPRGGNGRPGAQTPWSWDPNFLTYYPFDAYDFQSFTNPHHY